LQIGVAREFDQVRNFIRALAGRDDSSSNAGAGAVADPFVEVSATFGARSRLAERTFLIVLEGLRNSRRHANANSMTIDASVTGHELTITMSDDGIGFPAGAEPPWTIASHVAEAGGEVRIEDSHPAQLRITIPRV
jgi:signal transduction histidine kinase